MSTPAPRRPRTRHPRDRRGLVVAAAAAVLLTNACTSAADADPAQGTSFIGCPEPADASHAFNGFFGNLPDYAAVGVPTTATVTTEFGLADGWDSTFTGSTSTDGTVRATFTTGDGATASLTGTLDPTPTLVSSDPDTHFLHEFKGAAQLSLPAFPSTGFQTYRPTSVDLHLTLRTSQGVAIPHPEVPDTDGNPDTVDISCDVDPASTSYDPPASLTVGNGDAAGDTQPPTKPTDLAVTRITGIDARGTYTWKPSTDDRGVTAYDLYAGSDRIATTSGASTSVDAKLVTGTTPQTYTLRARDEAGNTSDPSDPLSHLECKFGPPFTSAANDFAAGTVTPTTATLTWDPTPANCAYPGSGFEVTGSEAGGTSRVLADITGASASTTTLTGLLPHTTYTVVLATVGGLSSPKTAPITFTTKALPTDQTQRYALAGSSTIKTLVKGALPISGSADATFGSDGALSATATFAPSTANFKALGVIPVTATVQLVATAPVTGQLTGTSLAAAAKVRIKFPSIKAFGIPLGGGTNCQASQITNVPLQSTGAFTVAAGGTLAGTFSISNLTGCGALNGLVSPITAGGGNAIALSLTPAA